MLRVQGMASLAARWGISREAVRQMAVKHGPESTSTTPMPRPLVAVERHDGKLYMYAWTIEQLTELDTWYEGIRKK